VVSPDFRDLHLVSRPGARCKTAALLSTPDKSRNRKLTHYHRIRLLDQPDRPCENVIQRWSLHLRDSRVCLRRYRLKVRT
jgi:hypothetical protein